MSASSFYTILLTASISESGHLLLSIRDAIFSCIRKSRTDGRETSIETQNLLISFKFVMSRCKRKTRLRISDVENDGFFKPSIRPTLFNLYVDYKFSPDS